MDRTESVSLLKKFVHGDALVKHCIATGAIMRSLATALAHDPILWEQIGILHDIDFEDIGGDMERHGITGAQILTGAGIPSEIAEIIRRHNHFLHNGTYDRPVEIALQAADSASGLILACALVKGGNLSDVSVRTIVKKAKEKSFAAGCDRNRIALITSLMEIPVFYEHALAGMMSVRSELGLK